MQLYHDDKYGFEVSYPSDYILLPAKSNSQQQPQPAHEVQFLSKMLANSDTAALQLPEFAIEVYDNANDQPLDEWLRVNSLLPASFASQPYSLANADGLQVTNPQQLAPNQFFYLAHGSQIYRLIPLGATGSQIMNTLKFTK